MLDCPEVSNALADVRIDGDALNVPIVKTTLLFQTQVYTVSIWPVRARLCFRNDDNLSHTIDLEISGEQRLPQYKDFKVKIDTHLPSFVSAKDIHRGRGWTMRCDYNPMAAGNSLLNSKLRIDCCTVIHWGVGDLNDLVYFLKYCFTGMWTPFSFQSRDITSLSFPHVLFQPWRTSSFFLTPSLFTFRSVRLSILPPLHHWSTQWSFVRTRSY